MDDLRRNITFAVDPQSFLAAQASVAEVALDPVITMDSNGIVRAWNSMATEVFGFSKEEAVGFLLADLIIPPHLQEAHRAGIERYLETEQGLLVGRRVEVEGMTKAGDRIPIELSITPVNVDGRKFFTAFLRDVRQQKEFERHLRSTAAALDETVRLRTQELAEKNVRLEEAERKAREGREELQDYIDQMTTLNAKISVDGKIMLLNRAAAMAEGSAQSELVGKRFLGLSWCGYDPIVLERITDAFNRASKGEHILYEEEIFIFGQVRTILFNLVPVFGDPDQVLYVVAEGRDISERKQVELELRERSEQLEISNRELEAFSYSVSHDLRGPLRAVDGYSHAVLEDFGDLLSSEGRDYLSRIRSSAQRMARLIDDLLNLSRLTRIELHKQKVDLSKIASDVAQELSTRDPARNVNLSIQTGLTAEADPVLIQALVGNLLGNAWKFTAYAEPAQIEMGMTSNEGAPSFFVRDNGVGFDMAYAGKLFGAFERLHSPKEFPGSGVGLATAYRIVQRHGGEIWTESQPNKGATFYFTLPGSA